jgi:energy-coupling factor transport system permease protein
MSPLEPIADPTAPLGRRNPLAKLLAASVLSLLLLFAVDPVTPAVALVLEFALVPLAGIRPGMLLRRARPLLLGAFGVFVTTLLFTTHRGGTMLVPLGPVSITTDALNASAGLSVRLLALALPGLLAFASMDPTELADALIQQARVPARFAIGALAALRLAPLLFDDWRSLSLARRARGIAAGRNPLAQVRQFAATTFALLVGAIRRGTRLATAMDARGFAAGLPRTYARTQRFTWGDGVVLLGAVAIAATALTISLRAGTFRPLF